jgi:hypothetical protein
MERFVPEMNVKWDRGARFPGTRRRAMEALARPISPRRSTARADGVAS